MSSPRTSQVQPEQVLAFDAAWLERLGYYNGFKADPSYLDPVEHELEFRDRSQVEIDPALKHLATYAVLRCDGRIFTYRRTSGGGEGRLYGKRSIGVGGHVNPCDGDPSATGMLSVFDTAAEREVAEEIRIHSAYSKSLIGYINDDSNDVGRVHFGVVYVFDLERPDVDFERDDKHCDKLFATPDQLLADINSYESWSCILIRRLAGGQPPR